METMLSVGGSQNNYNFDKQKPIESAKYRTTLDEITYLDDENNQGIAILQVQ